MWQRGIQALPAAHLSWNHSPPRSIVMSEQPISPDPQAPLEIGKRLAQARESAALSVDQVATRLLVSASQIRAIEAGRMPSSYSADYYASTVQKYAEFLNLDMDQGSLPSAAAAIGVAHAAAQDASPAGRLAGFTPQRVGIAGRVDMPTIDSGWNARPWIVGLVVLLLAAIVFVYWDKMLDPVPAAHEQGSAEKTAAPGAAATPDTVAPAPVAGASTSSAQPATSPAQSTTSPPPAALAGADPSSSAVTGSPGASAPGTTASGRSDASAAATAAVSTTTPAGGSHSSPPQGSIQVTFAAPCWVQTVARDGTKAEKIYQPGQELIITAGSVSSLVIGNAKSARMVIDGTEVNLNQYMRGSSDVVRIQDLSVLQPAR